MNISAKQFAERSFENDRMNGIYDKSMRFKDLDAEEREIYFSEASEYMTIPQEEWPEDVLARFE